MSDGALCGAPGCFDAATFEVIPKGRWRNVPITKACRKCAKNVAGAYKTKAVGEPGWADLVPIEPPKKTTKRPNASTPKRKRPKKKVLADSKAQPIKEATG